MTTALRFKVASPCTETWESMVGDGRARHCASCQLTVHNLTGLRRDEVEAVLRRAGGGRVCARFYQRADGTVLTEDCPRGLALVRRRMLAGVTMAFALLLGTLGFGVLRIKKSCAVPGGASWLERNVSARALTAREALRHTKTFGPLIDELWPDRSLVMGDIAPPPP